MRLDGVLDAPTWTFDYGFDPKMGETIGVVTELPRHPARTHDLRDVRAVVSTRTVEDDPGPSF